MGLFNILKKRKNINDGLEEKFPFSEGLYFPAYTCRHVMDKKREIYYASHDENGDWTFLCKDCSENLDFKAVMFVALCEIYSKQNIKKYSNLEKNTQSVNDQISIKPNDEYQNWFTKVKQSIAEHNYSWNENQLRSDFSGKKLFKN